MPEKTKPAGPSGGHRELLVTNWKAYEKNTLRAFLSLTLPSEIVIHNCALHQKGDARWIELPSRQYKKEDGTLAYSPLIEFANDDSRRRFQAAALAAVDRFMKGHGSE
jgi:DNA-binding cell septation regulator SpoVG